MPRLGFFSVGSPWYGGVQGNGESDKRSTNNANAETGTSMAWETRSTRQYYYRAKRVNGRIEKTYLGAGDVARHAAEKDAAARAKHAADRAELAEFQARLAGVDGLAGKAEQGVELLTEATLLAIGFRNHRGEWRLNRGR